VPRVARAAYLVTVYGDLIADPTRLDAVIGQLAPVHAAEMIASWRKMADAGAFRDLAASLMEHHYDPRYAKHRARVAVPVTEITAAGLGPDDLTGLADAVARLVTDGRVAAL
jgi:tRNA 2-selenouridine synthase